MSIGTESTTIFRRVLDGSDISPVLFGTGPSPREVMFFYRGEQLYAVRAKIPQRKEE